MTTRREPGPLPLSDFGLHHVAVEPYERVRPASEDEVIAIVREARAEGARLRVRAGGHTLGGACVPRPGERLVDLGALRDYRFGPATLHVGAGAAMWDVRDFLAERGFGLPVVNNGSSGPTVGGLLAAGGLGPGSREHGGLWCNVASITAVDGRGERVVLRAGDEELAYWFGSLGALGVVTEVELVMLPLEEGGGPDVAGERGVIPTRHPQREPRYVRPGEPSEEELAFWVTTLVDTRREAPALHDLLQLIDAHASASLRFLPIFRYRIADLGMRAPLVYPEPGDFSALFLWGKAKSGAGSAAVAALERDFDALATRRGYRRYHQTELVSEGFDYRAYYGDAIYDHFLALRAMRDPDGILNEGVLRVAPPIGALA